MRYNVICTNDENPLLRDTKMYLSHVEYQVRDAVTDMVVQQGNANNTVPNVLQMGACPF